MQIFTCPRCQKEALENYCPHCGLEIFRPRLNIVPQAAIGTAARAHISLPHHPRVGFSKMVQYLAMAGLIWWMATTVRLTMEATSASFSTAVNSNAKYLFMYGCAIVAVFIRPRTWGFWFGLFMLF